MSLFFFFSFLLSTSQAQHQRQNSTISSVSSSSSPWKPLQNRTLLSPNAVFAAGFLPLLTSPRLYSFSVWYHKLPNRTVVWSSDDKSPLSSSATLFVTASGQLRLTNSSSSSSSSSSGENLWPSSSRARGDRNKTRLVLLDDGNLVCASWASFDFPTDTFLPNQTINASLVSKNGVYRFVNSSELVFDRTEPYWNSEQSLLRMDSDGGVSKSNGERLLPADSGSSDGLRRLKLDADGNLRMYSSDPDSGLWTVVYRAIGNICKIYGKCGPNFVCSSDGSDFDSYRCVCPPGFRRADSGDACERNIPISPSTRTKFLRLDYVKYSGDPDPKARSFSECESQCLKNPKCVGFGFKYNGAGYCAPYVEQLLYGHWSPGTELVSFLRVDISEPDSPIGDDGTNFTGKTNVLETMCPVQISIPYPPKRANTTIRNVATICTIFAAELFCGALFLRAFLKKYVNYRDMAGVLGMELLHAGGPKRFGYAELKTATRNFSDLIGRGGFGEVYKGELPDHRVVAVKCLKNIAGGDSEFWAELTIIARMHHLNLVRLWGFCAEKGQRILVYEYIPNGSLNKFLFPSGDGEDSVLLDWGIRYRIALGVARAIAYLHEECLEWVLHCDIKPENILLGDDFCPKLSDFGLAKLRKREDMVSMSRLRGTRGYMAPEWVRSGRITPKADVYSFGMVLLEIVSGSRNNEVPPGMGVKSEEWYFPTWAHEKVFGEKRVEEILDRRIRECFDSRMHSETVSRMVKTAICCLQDQPEMRPSMGKVVKMLEGTVEITEPQKPPIFFLQDQC